MPMLPQPQMPVRPGGATIINMGGGG
jgi:hypothetical protein